MQSFLSSPSIRGIFGYDRYFVLSTFNKSIYKFRKVHLRKTYKGISGLPLTSPVTNLSLGTVVAGTGDGSICAPVVS